MMRSTMCVLATALVSIGTLSAAGVEPSPVSPEEARQWIRYTVPLPRQIEVVGKVVLPVSRVAVLVAGSAKDPLIEQAVKELREVIGGDAATIDGKDTFAITLQLGGEQAEPLRQHRYADQAYSVRPEAGGLRCVAAGPRGLYYAGKTLQQLIKAKARGGQIELPVARVTDWPDLEDRGLWGGDSSQNIRWLSDRKMNYLEHISHTTIGRDRKCAVGYPPFKQRMIDEGPTYGMNPVPVILHLEQLKSSGLFEVHPDLQGKDATPGVICYSNPVFSDVLAEWLVLWGKTPGVREVDVWMAENMYGKEACKCDRCKTEERAVLEARAIVRAWEIARRQLPGLGLRMLTSEASESANARFFPTLPPGLKIWYYHSLLSYNTSRRPMINKLQPYLPETIRSGRWVGICPNLSAYVGLWMPMSSPVFIHARMNEFADKGLQGLIGYAVPVIAYCRMNTEAAAEWSWNAKGRSTREFAASYAVRNGYRDADRFAEWCEVMGPVSWDVYGSSFPAGEQRNQPGKLAELVRTGKLPGLGDVLWDVYGIPFGDIQTVEQLTNDVAQAARGVELARAMAIEEYLHESLVVQGFIDAIHALYQLKQVVRPEGLSDKAAAARWFRAYLAGLAQAREHLPAWELSVRERDGQARLTAECVKLLAGMAEGMQETAKGLGIELP